MLLIKHKIEVEGVRCVEETNRYLKYLTPNGEIKTLDKGVK